MGGGNLAAPCPSQPLPWQLAVWKKNTWVDGWERCSTGRQRRDPCTFLSHYIFMLSPHAHAAYRLCLGWSHGGGGSAPWEPCPVSLSTSPGPERSFLLSTRPYPWVRIPRGTECLGRAVVAGSQGRVLRAVAPTVGAGAEGRAAPPRQCGSLKPRLGCTETKGPFEGSTLLLEVVGLGPGPSFVSAPRHGSPFPPRHGGGGPHLITTPFMAGPPAELKPVACIPVKEILQETV